MAVEINPYGVRYTGVAAVDLSSGKQYHFVKAAGSTDAQGVDVTTIAAATDRPCGVLMDDPVAGGECAIVAIGIVKCYVASSAGVTAGDLLTIDATGAVVTAVESALTIVSGALDAVADSQLGQRIVGQALVTAAASTVALILVNLPGTRIL